MKQVRETAAGQSIAATVVLNKRGQVVAKVHAHFADSGRVRVDVFQVGDGPIERSLKAAGYNPEDARDRDEYMKRYYMPMACQQGAADGGGYDKFTAALSGLWIDGYRIADHCGHNDQTERLQKRYRKALAQCTTEAEARDVNRQYEEKARRIGARFANFCRRDDGLPGWGSLFLESGLDRLQAMGYTVINAI